MQPERKSLRRYGTSSDEFFRRRWSVRQLGWQVFPLRPGSKEPWPGSRGVRDASDDAELLATWAEHDNTSNVAIACGKSGLIVVEPAPRVLETDR